MSHVGNTHLLVGEDAFRPPVAMGVTKPRVRCQWHNNTLFPKLHFIPGLGSLCVLLERGYARLVSALWRVDPRPLFDSRYYFTQYPDVVTSGMDPFCHFLLFGAAEKRRPHPLFDTNYYLARYPDVARSRYNPLLHFLRFGGMEGRCPHPDFDSFFYLASNRDIAQARVNPLVHFVESGAAEGRYIAIAQIGRAHV